MRFWYCIARMDVRQLRYFIAVAEARNFGRAAERLHLSQPPLTRQIQALEQELGVQLFVRTPRGVDLTQAGERLLADARNITGLVGQATERAQRAGRGQVGRLDVGVYGSAMYDIVPRLLADFTAGHPAVSITLHHAQTPQQVEALRHGRVRIVFERQVPDEADIAVELVAREPIMLAINARHPLADEVVVPMEALRGQALVMQAGAASALTNVAMALCRAHGVEPAELLEVNDVLTGTMLVATMPVMCLVPASISRVQLPNVVYRPIRSRIDASMELHCFYLRDDRSPLLAAMLATIRQHRHTDQPAPSRSSKARLRASPQR